MRVIRKKPGQDYEWVDISNTLESLQHEVEGYIEVVPIGPDTIVVCNEEGSLVGLKDNVDICGYRFVGTILITGTNGDELTDYTGDDFI